MLELPKRSYLDAVVGQFEQEINNLNADEAYYKDKARRDKNFAWLFRGPAILLFLAGTMAPFIYQMMPEVFGINLLAVGYLSLALAAGFMVVDRVSLFTESHISEKNTQVALSLMKQRLLLEKNATLPAAENEDAAKILLPLVAKTVGQFATDRASLVRSQTDAWGVARRAAQEEFSQLVSKVRDEARIELAQKRAEQAEESRHGALTVAVSYPQDYSGRLLIVIDHDESDISDVSRSYDEAPAQIAFPSLRPGIVRVKAQIETGAILQDIAIIKPGEVSPLKMQFP